MIKKAIALILIGWSCTCCIYAQLPPIDSISIVWERVSGISGQANGVVRLGNELFAATQTGLYISENNGQTWARHTGMNHEPLLNIWRINDTLFLQQFDKVSQSSAYSRNEAYHIYRSVDGGLTFQSIADYSYTNMYSTDGYTETIVHKMEAVGDFFYAFVEFNHPIGSGFQGIEKRLWYSFDRGVNWSTHTLGMAEPFPSSFASYGDTLVGFMEQGFRFYTESNLTDYTETVLGDSIYSSTKFWAHNENSYAGYQPWAGRIIQTQDFQHFDTAHIDLMNLYFFGMAGSAFIYGREQGIFTASTNNPTDIQPLDLSTYFAPAYLPGLLQTVQALSTDELFISLKCGYSFRSTDAGQTWQRADKGLGSPYPIDIQAVEDSRKLPWIKWDGYLYQPENESQWRLYPSEQGQAIPFLPITQYPDFWLDGAGRKSFDNGLIWQPAGTGFSLLKANYTRDAGRILAFSPDFSNLLLTVDDGNTWTPLSPDWVNGKQILFAWSDTIVVIGYNQVAISADEGMTWMNTYTFPESLAGIPLLVGDELRVLLNSGKLYTSNNRGYNWTLQNSFDLWSSIGYFTFKHYLVDQWWLAPTNGAYPLLSADKGLNWFYAPGSPKNLFGEIDYFYYSKNQVLEILPFEMNDFLYVLSPAAGMWRTPIADLNNQWSIALGENVSDTIQVDTSLCMGEQFEGQTIQSDTILFNNATDTVWVYHITLLPTDTASISLEICQNEISPISGQLYSNAGEFTEQVVFQNQYGCDSVVNVQVIVHPIEYGEAWAVVPYGAIQFGVSLTEDTCLTVYDVTAFGCPLIVGFCVYVLPSATEDIAESFALNIYPNPTSGDFFIEVDLPKAMEISIEAIDPMGRRVAALVKNEAYLNGKKRLKMDSSQWPSGPYQLRVQAGGAVLFQKLIKI